jgi:hypothetical protein
MFNVEKILYQKKTVAETEEVPHGVNKVTFRKIVDKGPSIFKMWF